MRHTNGARISADLHQAHRRTSWRPNCRRRRNVIRNGKAEARAYRVDACNHDPSCTFPKPITVPPDEYFVPGDNLPVSDDSRFWGPIKRSWLIGLVKSGS